MVLRSLGFPVEFAKVVYSTPSVTFAQRSEGVPIVPETHEVPALLKRVSP